MKQIIKVFSLLGFLVSAQAGAQLYAGAAIGLVDTDGDEKIATTEMHRLFAGYKLFEYVSLEFGLGEFASLDGKVSNASARVKYYDYGIVGAFPFLETHKAYLRVGNTHWEADGDNGAFGTARETFSITGEDINYSLGYAVEIAESGAARIEFSRYDIGIDGAIKVDAIDTFSVGLEARF